MRLRLLTKKCRTWSSSLLARALGSRRRLSLLNLQRRCNSCSYSDVVSQRQLRRREYCHRSSARRSSTAGETLAITLQFRALLRLPRCLSRPFPLRQALHLLQVVVQGVNQSRSMRRYGAAFACAAHLIQESLRFDYENLRQSASIRADPLLPSFDVPPTLELITVERKRRYPLPNNFVLILYVLYCLQLTPCQASLLKEPALRPYIKYYLAFFAKCVCRFKRDRALL